jgi:uracil-DNA glycosylase
MEQGSDAHTLDELVAAIRACRHCEVTTERPPLPHPARPVVRLAATARILIAGQAPGARVHASGLPFDDPSGVRLRAWMGVTEAEFYDASRFAFLPMGFCFPGNDETGGDLPPRPECAKLWRDRALRHLADVSLLLLVGQYAQRWHLGAAAKGGITATVGDWRRHAETGDGSPARPSVFPLPHPSWRNTAWLRMNPWFEADVVPAVQTAVRRVLDR